MQRNSFFCVLLLIILGCDSADFSVLDNEVVVELILIANEPLPHARVSKLSPADEPGSFASLAIRNAQVILSLKETEFLMEPVPGKPGLYQYFGPEHITQPSARYDLRVTLPGDEATITGFTNVPSSVKILNASRETGTYLSDEQLTLIIVPGRASDQSQTSFTLVTEALDVKEGGMVPTVSGMLDDDDELTLEDFRISGSPIITEGNFTRFSDGTIMLIYPWIGVNFYGRNIIYINALDGNLADFVQSAELQQGGNGTFGPGVIPNVIPSLSGAHGVFGSVARDQVRFTVFPPNDP